MVNCIQKLCITLAAPVISIRGLTKKPRRASIELVSHKNKNIQNKKRTKNEALAGADLQTTEECSNTPCCRPYGRSSVYRSV